MMWIYLLMTRVITVKWGLLGSNLIWVEDLRNAAKEGTCVKKMTIEGAWHLGSQKLGIMLCPAHLIFTISTPEQSALYFWPSKL